MKQQRLGMILLFLSLSGLVSLELFRVNRERELLRLQFAQQRDSIRNGLQLKWRETLLAAAHAGRVPKTFLLRYNRTGRTMLTPFYPIREVRLAWNEYRALPEGDSSSRQKFLRQALGMPRSWDRVLALREWTKRFG